MCLITHGGWVSNQRVFEFVGKSRHSRSSGITLSGLRIIGASMPQNYVFMCRGTGAGGSPAGADCAADGGPDTADETNTSPRPVTFNTSNEDSSIVNEDSSIET